MKTMRKFSRHCNTIFKSLLEQVFDLVCYYSLQMSLIAFLTTLGLTQLSRCLKNEIL